MRSSHNPGVVALAGGDTTQPPEPLRRLLANEGLSPARNVNGVWLAAWGLARDTPDPQDPLLLSSTLRSDAGTVAAADIATWLAECALVELGRMLPPFAALGLAPGGLRVAADQMGFRQLFTCEGDGWSAVSTSALLLSRLCGQGLDREGLLLQSQLGWQLGQMTLFKGVVKLSPGEAVFLHSGGIRRESAELERPEPGTLALEDGVEQATVLLRDILTTYVDDTPEVMQQLTGGQDSRILLSAIPREKRSRVRAMTLDNQGGTDARIAGDIAAIQGMEHTVRFLESLGDSTPAKWFARVMDEALHNDCMNDPLAHAVIGWAEEYFEQGHRLSGVGGEIGRGFYYTGTVKPRSVTRRRSEALARWRMLANEAVEPSLLEVSLRREALPLSLDLIHAALVSAGPEWYTATDELYYRHRMQRWAGSGETAVCFRRILANPLLDHRFVDIARRLSPRDKQRSLFIGRLQVSLDPDLASIPLEGRPPPRVLADRGPVSRAHLFINSSGRLVRKVRQRATNSSKPPRGVAVVADKLTQHFRQEPGTLDPVRDLNVFDDGWLAQIVGGDLAPSPSSLALLMNVLAATTPEDRG